MRIYKGYKYQIKHHEWWTAYTLYNEKGEIEAEFVSFAEVKEAVNNRIKYGYWAY